MPKTYENSKFVDLYRFIANNGRKLVHNVYIMANEKQIKLYRVGHRGKLVYKLKTVKSGLKNTYLFIELRFFKQIQTLSFPLFLVELK